MATDPRVLIVDEDLDSRVEARKALQRARLQIAGEVGFGAQAVALAHETKPDVILVSVEEPVTRPLETVESLANVLPQTPLIFYASLTDPQSVRRAALYGARDYLFKPLQASALHDAVIRALEFEEKRQMRQAGQLADAPLKGTVITVAGAKGGIGKSIVAVNLAVALRQQTNGRVAIVDADMDFGDVATMFDITPEQTATQLLNNIDKVDKATIDGYVYHLDPGLDILAAPRDDTNPWETARTESGAKIVDLLSLGHDFVVVDTSGAMDSHVRAIVNASTMVLLVTTGEVSSVRDTKAALSRLKSWGVPDEKIKLVFNRGARAEGVQVEDVEQTLGRPLFWEVPRDREVGRSVQIGRPVVLENPKAAAARNFVALAAAIGGNVYEPVKVSQNGIKTGGRQNGLLRRLLPARYRKATS